MRGREAPGRPRLQPLRRPRGDDLPHQGTRGLEAEEGAPVPGRVQPRPHAARRDRDVRPADRPRQGSRADHPDPLAADEEQPDPPRRAGRRQDRHRRGPRDPDRRGRGADVSVVQEDPGARPLAHRRRHQVPRPVRGAPQGDHPGAPREPGPHHLHRRDPLAHRRGLGRGLARRGEHPQAGALARRGVLHRRDDAQGVPQVHREGPEPPAPLPGDPRHGALGERDVRDPRGGQGSLRAVPQGPLLGRGDQDGGLPVQPLHHRPLLPGQGDRHPRRGRRQGEAQARGRHAEPPQARARDPADRQGDEEGDLRQGLREGRVPAGARDRAQGRDRARQGPVGREERRHAGSHPPRHRGDHLLLDGHPGRLARDGGGREAPPHGGRAAHAGSSARTPRSSAFPRPSGARAWA